MKAIAIVFFALVGLGHAELKWDSPEQAFTAQPTERAIVAKYRFTNTGATPVTIESVRTSCGCTTISLSKKEYQPGESSEIEARFEVAGRVGHQEKAILVTTKEAPQSPTRLRLRVEIPQAVNIEPQMVYWRVGEAPEPKTITVSVAEDSPAKIVKVVPDTPAIQVSVQEPLPGKKATLRVTPVNTSRAEVATLSIQLNGPADNPKAYCAYARIK